MSLDFEDRLLGEKVDYYCDSDEDIREEDAQEQSGEENDDEGKDSRVRVDQLGSKAFNREVNQAAPPVPSLPPRQGAHTGPKGVLEDYRQYKLMEYEKKCLMELDRLALAKRIAITCNSHREDAELDAQKEDWEKELEEMVDNDEFMQEYRQRRFHEMLVESEKMAAYGHVFDLNIDTFLTAVENEPSDVHVIIHLYEVGVSACEAMHGCLTWLAKDYPRVKFCRITATEAHLSSNFSENGVPALLFFKGGNQLGSVVAIHHFLGDDFFVPELEAFLLDKGFITPSLKKIQTPSMAHSGGGDSDYDVD